MLVCILGGIGTAGVPAGSLAGRRADPRHDRGAARGHRPGARRRPFPRHVPDDAERRRRPRRRAGHLSGRAGRNCTGGDATGCLMADTDVSVLAFGREMIHDEARALDALADALGDEFRARGGDDPRHARQTDRLRAGQVGAYRPQDRRDLRVDRDHRDLPPSCRGNPRRPRHRRGGRRRPAHFAERRKRPSWRR